VNKLGRAVETGELILNVSAPAQPLECDRATGEADDAVKPGDRIVPVRPPRSAGSVWNV